MSPDSQGVIHMSTNASNTTTIIPPNNRDAEWAAVIMTLLLVLLLCAVWYSQMWKHKDHYHWYSSRSSVTQSGDIFTPAPQMNIKELLKAKLRHLPKISFKRKPKSRHKNGGYVLVGREGDESVEISGDSCSDDDLYDRARTEYVA